MHSSDPLDARCFRTCVTTAGALTVTCQLLGETEDSSPSSSTLIPSFRTSCYSTFFALSLQASFKVNLACLIRKSHADDGSSPSSPLHQLLALYSRRLSPSTPLPRVSC